MAKIVLGTAYDGVRGANIEFGTFTINPAEIAADVEGDETVTMANLAVGDYVVVQAPSALESGLIVKGATVTDANELTVTLQNATESAITGAERTYFYVAYKIV